MRRFLAVYESVATEQILVFTVMVHDELAAGSALSAIHGACPNLRWTERSGIFGRAIVPQPPFEFLSTAVRT